MLAALVPFFWLVTYQIGPKPHDQRRTRVLKDRAGGHGRLVAARPGRPGVPARPARRSLPGNEDRQNHPASEAETDTRGTPPRVANRRSNSKIVFG